MLQRSLVKVRRRSPSDLLSASSSDAILSIEERMSAMLRLGARQLHKQHQNQRQTRTVATTSTSKIQQVVAQQCKLVNEHQVEQDEQFDAHNQSMEGYRARLDNLRLWQSVDAIKRHSHRLAQLDPLNMRQRESLRELAGWKQGLLDQVRASTDIVPTSGFLATKQPLMAVNELLETVWNIYAESQCGLEFGHISNEQEVEWLTSQWEKLNEIFHLDHLDEQNLAKLMIQCETFDHFVAAKFPTTKRYGCEGAEPMLVVLDETLRLCHLGAADRDEMTKTIGRIDDVIIGMPHRGRLNLLACLLGFEPMAIFSKIRGEPELDLSKAWMATGDVLSHLSTNTRFVYGLDSGHHIGLSRDTPDPINVTLLPNPSHLEVVSPMAAGTARGRAHNILHAYSSSPKFITFNTKFKAAKDSNVDYTKYLPNLLPIQIHGDASVSGQGIIQETLQMANLPQFSVGGSLHLVVNNQIGYTTDPTSGRSSRHCTDVFKTIEAPIIHVNAENIASVVRATRLALSYRQKFNKDIAINLFCYRRHGHNEMDEPSFTQPQMYNIIRNRKSIPQKFCDQIGMDELERQQIADDYKARLQEAYIKSERYKPDNDNYRNFKLPSEFHRAHLSSWQTGCDLETLRKIALDSVSVPEGFSVHPNLERVLIKERRGKFELKEQSAVIDKEQLDSIKVDWATAEILAFGSLLKQNHSIRLAGQDVARGTFSTRHAVLYDQKNGQAYTPLNKSMKRESWKQKAQLEVANTILSEEAALAFEFGYSAETCELTIWEAQFGDFFNTAQSIIDTLVSSSESKWLKQSPLTLLLPHGLDGAGPEHSSSHIERFLQMCNSSSSPESIDTEAKVNWSICFPTLPSQYFHLLRRQVLRPFRKPLVVMSPKVIFRHPECQSQLAHFGPDSKFMPVLDDPSVGQSPGASRELVNTIVLCSGKVYFQLSELKRKEKMSNVALIRLEELCPFPVQAIAQVLKQYPNVQKSRMFWFQEEHKNQGAYQFVDCRLQNMANIRLKYLGRAESELPATGSGSLHKRELEHLAKQFQSLKQSSFH